MKGFEEKNTDDDKSFWNRSSQVIEVFGQKFLKVRTVEKKITNNSIVSVFTVIASYANRCYALMISVREEILSSHIIYPLNGNNCPPCLQLFHQALTQRTGR